MKKGLLFIFCITLSQHILSQELNVHTTASVNISSGASLNVSGLELTPSADYIITDNTITYSGTTTMVNGNPSIARRYFSANSLSGYVGAITVHYQDGEIGSGLDEAALTLGVQDDGGVWSSHLSSVDISANTVAANFSSSINFKGVTASNDIPLSIENLHNDLIEISIYPNPVTSKLFIKSDIELNFELFDLLGKSVFKTNNPTIDLTPLNSALYILKVTDQATSKSNTYKIIKK